MIVSKKACSVRVEQVDRRKLGGRAGGAAASRAAAGNAASTVAPSPERARPAEQVPARQLRRDARCGSRYPELPSRP